MENFENNKNDIPEFINLYLKAIKLGTLPQFYFDRFISLRDKYFDDLPEEDVRNLVTLDENGNFVGQNYKCRGNYIVGLSITLSAAIEDRVINETELMRKIKEFKKNDFGFEKNEFTTQNEIDMINNILNDVIGFIESKYPCVSVGSEG